MDTQNTFQRRYQKLQDFNLVYINNFSRAEMPEIVTGTFLKRIPLNVTKSYFLVFKKTIINEEIPSEVLQSLSESGKEVVSFNSIVYKKSIDPTSGEVFYDSYVDQTEAIKEALNTAEVKSTIFALKDLVGRQTMSRSLIMLPAFKFIETASGNFALSFEEEAAPASTNIRTTKIILTSTKDSSVIMLDFGKIIYSIYGRRN